MGISQFIMISKELLFIPGENKISIININEYKIIREWNIEGNTLELISIKENTHNDSIYTLLNIGNGFIASGSYDNSIKIW